MRLLSVTTQRPSGTLPRERDTAGLPASLPLETKNEHSYLIDCAGFTPLNGSGTAMFVICIAVIRHGR
jgi:hypothetical protein